MWHLRQMKQEIDMTWIKKKKKKKKVTDWREGQMTEGQTYKELTERTNTSSMDRGLTLLFWMSLRMCSKQLLFRNTAWRTGLSEHCRISGTAAKIGNKEDVDSFIRHWGNQLSGLHTDWERNLFYSAGLETVWTRSYLAFGFEGRSGRLPSSACPAPHC